MADFDVIIVGAGCAGSVAAHQLAKSDKSVLLIERGERAGSKNMTGGRLYSHSLRTVFPDFASAAPLERKITHERISLLNTQDNTTIDYTSTDLNLEKNESYSVLRAKFDPWLAEQAESAGAEAIYGIAVESLVKEGSKVTGVHAGEDDITADLVILADGTNSLLSKQAVGYAGPTPSTMAVGIKQVLELDPKIIQAAFMSNQNEGAAWLFLGEATNGRAGGGFLYTNQDSISLGLVITIADLTNAQKTLVEIFEDFKNHPSLQPLISGARVLEHSGHMVPEGGLKMMPKLYGDGVLLAGESAMMCVNLGYQVRGMDYAIEAGRIAAIAAEQALENSDTSSASLANYETLLKETFVLKDLTQFEDAPAFMEHTKRLYTAYPQLVGGILNKMFVVDGKPTAHLKSSIMPLVKEIGYLNLLKDLSGGMKAL